MKAFIREAGIAAPIEGRNIDTDQIVPARYLKTDRSQGYGRYLFHDLRFDADGAEQPHFILNRAPFRNARILVADANFGCGSSREAAAYALHDFGIRTVIAPSFGDIFYNNCLKNGIMPVRLAEPIVTALRHSLHPDRNNNVMVDLEALSVTLPGGATHGFTIDPFWRECLLQGKDDLELTLGHAQEIDQFESAYHAEMPWARM